MRLKRSQTVPFAAEETYRLSYENNGELVKYQFAKKNITLPTVVIARASSPRQSLTTEIASSFHSSQ